jgi:SAM-dependent methyltransferase
MADERNPQAEQMADESMVRCLEAQARAIWPQEAQLIREYGLRSDARVVDFGCGTGEFARRFAADFEFGSIEGIDLIDSHLERARRKCAGYGERVRFQHADAFAAPFAADLFDLSVCRHMLQSVPTPGKVIEQMIRVTCPGGRVHILAEDYAMMHFHPVDVDTDRFWHDGPIAYGEKVGVDLRIGRKMFSILSGAGLAQVSVRYVVVDTLRVEREVFAATWEAWRDGFTEPIVEHGRLARDEVDRAWAAMLECIRDPDGYAIWQVPVISGVVPE